MKKIDILFDGPPGPESGRFVEVEDVETGRSICFGEWVDRGNGLWALRFDVDQNIVELERMRDNERRLAAEGFVTDANEAKRRNETQRKVNEAFRFASAD